MSDGANENARSETTSSLPPNFSQLIDKVLANPEIIGAVASALSGSGTEPNAEGEKTEEAESVTKTPKSEGASADVSEVMKKLPDLAKLLTSQGSSKTVSAHGGYDRRAGLLNAIKPYMSKNRCDAIDHIIGFSRIADVLKNFK